MSLELVSTEEDGEYAFVAKIDNAKHLLNLLKAIHFKEVATFFISENGMKVTVEDGKCMLGNAFIQSDIFQDFVIKEETVTFTINLTALLECLNIFGSGNNPNAVTALKMRYRGYGSPLILVLEESGILTDCKLNTQETVDVLDFDFSTESMVNKIIMQSEPLKEVWSDLNANSDTLEIKMSPNKPYLRLTTSGAVGNVEVDFDKESDAVEVFQCTQTQTNRYRMTLLKPSLKALAVSTKISIRTDDRGFLCLQYMIRMGENQTCFVEYMCCPDEDVN